MAGVASGGCGDSSAEALAEWRASEQLENGSPSTSLPYWDTDDDEDSGLRPSQLYGNYDWVIDNFSQINKRELRSDTFKAGGYKWYILIYPQGCDVCNHLSLFLCVADHDKLLPGWSHFAQFTIAVENKDKKKSKYSDTLHRFWKKEHDWGWKKFMELNKVLEGFIDKDTLTIKAQVQVIREKADRLFRCLSHHYRKELVRVYLTSIEQICRRFVEERRSMLGKLIEDKARWSSLCAFWLGIDQKSRRSMTRERTNSILRVVVKHFFIEKEVTSTLVMDSLHSGLKALESQIKLKKSRRNLLGSDKLPTPIIHIDQDMFVLVDDVLLLLERAAMEPLPPKDEKGPQNRMKDGSSGFDCSDETLDRDLRRLTELGRRTIEIFVLDHIFSKIEVAYQDAIALKRQEELIREEAAWLETEQKSKRGEKEKKSKKKQGKQKRNNRKVKDKGRDENAIAHALDKLRLETPDEDAMAELTKSELENHENFEDVSDVSDTIDHATCLDLEERESSPTSGGGASVLSSMQNGESNGSCTVVDDSSSTCSTDSVPSVVLNGFVKASNPVPNKESQRSHTREKNPGGRATSDISGWVNEGSVQPLDVRRDVGPQDGSSGSRKGESQSRAGMEYLLHKLKKVEPLVAKFVSHQTEPIIKAQAVTDKHPMEKTILATSSSINSTKNTPPFPVQPKLETKSIHQASEISIEKPLSDTPELAPSVIKSVDLAPHKSTYPPKPTEKPSLQELPVIMSRPSSAPIVPGPKPTTPVVSMVQSQPLLSRSVSAIGRLDPDPTSSPHHQLSYRNTILGTDILFPPTATSSGYTLPKYIGPTHADSIYQRSGTINPLSMPNDVYDPDLFNQVCMTSHNSQSHSGDEFPHLDIIYDLLDDEYVSSTRFDGRSQHFNRQFSYPGDFGMMTNDGLLGPSTSSSRFQRTHSYHENGFQPSYSSFGEPFETSRDFFPQQNLRPFPNGQMNMSVPNQWQAASPDLSYPYNIPDYSNLGCNSNGYSVYRPSYGL